MPKTFKHLYPRIYDFENLYRAYRKARKGGKRKREEVAAKENSSPRSRFDVFYGQSEALGRIR
jgi:hypothetical protein